MSTVGLLYARTTEGLFSYKGLPWQIPEELARFKAITTHSTVIMGRGTWDSLPVKPLPDRTNIIMTHRHDVPLDHPYVECAAGSLSITIGYQRALDPEVPIWVIGGAVLLEEALELRDTDTVIETVIDGYDHRYVHSDHAVYFRPNLYRNKAWRKVDETSRWLWDRNKGKPPAGAVPSKDAGYYRVTEYCYRKR